MERQRAAYRVILHRAEDLPRMDTGVLASVKKAMLLNKTDFIDAYVRVSFVGHTVRSQSLISDPEKYIYGAWGRVGLLTIRLRPENLAAFQGNIRCSLTRAQS